MSIKGIVITPALAVVLTTLSALVSVSPGAAALTPHAPILIDGDSGFTVSNGVISGSGAWNSPYMIDGWEIDASTAKGIEIRNANVHFIIRNVSIHSGRASFFDGIFLSNSANGQIENVTVTDSFGGIHLTSSSNISISSSMVSNNSLGIYLESSRDSRIFSNRISNGSYGIYLFGSVNISVAGNDFVDDGVFLWGSSVSHFNSHMIAPDNLVNGFPVRYYKNCNGLDVDRLPSGQILMANCVSVTISNISIAQSEAGIEMAYVDDVLILNAAISDSLYGVLLYSSTNVSVINATVIGSSGDAVSVQFSPGTEISLSNLLQNWRGVYLTYSSDTMIASTIISNSTREGVSVTNSNNVRISGCTLSGNLYGVYLDGATGVLVHHNNFVDNYFQASDNMGNENSWDNGYPSGGNHWDDYSGADILSGPNQDQPEGDGIGDTPNALDFDSADSYPLMEFYPDMVAPIVSIASPSAGQFIRSSPVSVAGSAYDLGGIDRIEVRVDGGPWLAATGKSSWTAPMVLAQGPNLIEAVAWDRAGNPSAADSVSVFFDPDIPILTIVTPTEGQRFNVSTLSVSGTASDILSGLDRVEVSCDDGGSWSIASGNDSWIMDCSGLTDGIHRFRARAFDLAGWESLQSNVTVQVDTTVPTIAITAPIDGEWLNVSDVYVAGTTFETGSGLDRVEVSCDGGSTWGVAAGTSSWTYSCIGMSEGQVTIHARAYDMIGWESEPAVAVVRIDLTPPMAAILEPADGKWVTTSSLTVIGTASDTGGSLDRVEVSCDGGLSWNVAVGTISWTRNCTLSEGPNTIQARTFDMIGWESLHVSAVVKYDPDAPVLAIASPADGDWSTNASVILIGTAGDPTGPGMSGLDHIEASCDDGVTWGNATGNDSWTYVCADLVEGMHVLRAKAFDIAGHRSAILAVTIQVDTVPPSIAFSFPANGAIVRESLMNVAGTASDTTLLSAVKVRVGLGGWMIAQGTMSWVATVSLSPGNNIVQAQSFDAAGNPSLIVSIMAFYDNERPQVGVTCDSLVVDAGATVRCSVVAYDNQSVPDIRWSVTKGGAVVASGAGSNVTFLASDSGDYLVAATATDSAGNTGTADQTVTAKSIIVVDEPADLYWLVILIVVIVAVASILLHVHLIRRTRKNKGWSRMPTSRSGRRRGRI